MVRATWVYAAHSFAGPLSIGRHPPPPIFLQGMLTPNLWMTECPDSQHHRQQWGKMYSIIRHITCHYWNECTDNISSRSAAFLAHYALFVNLNQVKNVILSKQTLYGVHINCCGWTRSSSFIFFGPLVNLYLQEMYIFGVGFLHESCIMLLALAYTWWYLLRWLWFMLYLNHGSNTLTFLCITRCSTLYLCTRVWLWYCVIESTGGSLFFF